MSLRKLLISAAAAVCAVSLLIPAAFAASAAKRQYCRKNRQNNKNPLYPHTFASFLLFHPCSQRSLLSFGYDSILHEIKKALFQFAYVNDGTDEFP